MTWSSQGPANGRIVLYAVNPDGSLAQSGSTANGYGHWFDASGKVSSYANGYVYSEFDPSTLSFNIGQYPGKSVNGDTYTIRQTLRYRKNPSAYANANFVFNITIGGAASAILTEIDYTDPRTLDIQTVNGTSSAVDAVYDLSGRKLVNGQWSLVNGQLPKGIYIVNGRKVVVK